MAKFVTLSLARLSLKNIPKNRLIVTTNIVIFISLFAIFSSIISLVYEKKIEGLNKQLTNEQANEIIYNHWLSETPKNIRNIESLISQVSRENNYLIYLQNLNDKLITDRDIVLNPTINLIRFSRFHISSLNDSLGDAIIVSSSTDDIENIISTKNLVKTIDDDFFGKTIKNGVWLMNYANAWSLKSDEKKQEIYKEALIMRPFLIDNLEKLINLNMSFNLNYYSEKKKESQSKILRIKQNIKKISKKESRAIFIAFLIQLIIFGIIQFFEFGFELINKRKK